jgi:hypothetical protein
VHSAQFDNEARAVLTGNRNTSTTGVGGHPRSIGDLLPGIPRDVLTFAKRMLNWDLPNLPPASVLLRDPFFDEVRTDPLLQEIENDAFKIEVRVRAAGEAHR